MTEQSDIVIERELLDITIVENVTPDNVEEFPQKDNHLYMTVITEKDVQEQHLDYVGSLDRSDMTKPLVLVGFTEQEQAAIMQLAVQKLVEIIKVEQLEQAAAESQDETKH